MLYFYQNLYLKIYVKHFIKMGLELLASLIVEKMLIMDLFTGGETPSVK